MLSSRPNVFSSNETYLTGPHLGQIGFLWPRFSISRLNSTASCHWLKTHTYWDPHVGICIISFHNAYDFRSTTGLLLLADPDATCLQKSLFDSSVKCQYATQFKRFVFTGTSVKVIRESWCEKLVKSIRIIIRLACIEDSVDASIYELDDYIRKSKVRQITVTRNNTDNISMNRTTITRKQKLDEKQMYGYFKQQTDEILHKKTWNWLSMNNFKRKTQSLLIAAQNNTVRSNYVK